MIIRSILIMATMTLLTACGGELGTLQQSGGSSGTKMSAVADFIAQLQGALETNPKIVSISEEGAVDSTYTVILSAGKKLSIQRHSEDYSTLADATFSNFKVEESDPVDGKDASCLKEGLTGAKVAGFEPRYVGVLFSDTTMFFGYGTGEEQEMLSFDFATGECYASWK